MSYTSPFTGDVIQPTDVSYRAITLTENTQLEWPINGNTTTDVAARIMEVSASSAGLQLWMPPANQNSVGNDALIRNTGSNTFSVYSYAGAGSIVSVAAGQSKYIYITDNPTVSGTWGVIAFGVGTSSPDAATLAGYGLLAISNTLNQSHPTSSITNGATFATTDRAQTKIWSSGSGSITLPTASTLGDNWFVLFKNNGSGTCTINTTGGQLLDGLVSKTFNPTESAFIVCSGSSFVTIGYGVSNNFAFTALVKPVVSGSYSLTNAEVQNTIQEYTGTLTGNVTVTYPPVVNLYVISNQCVAGSYTLTVTTGVSGGATATIPSGQQATLVCDGTNFFNANTTQAGGTVISLINGSVGTPSLNFGSETNTGIYRSGAGQFAITILGSNVATFSATGLAIVGTGNFTGGISGGTY